MEQTYMKEQPVLKLILTLALPMVISMMVNSLYNIVDSFFVAKISEKAMTALSLVYPVQNLVNAVTIGFAIGINAVISYYLGAQDKKTADSAAAQGLILSTIHGVILTAGCIAAMPIFLSFFTSDEELVRMGLEYSNIVFSFSVIIAWGLSLEKIFQSVGKMGVTMICLMSGCIANIILDPLLIFGLGPIPAMGIRGAALATGLGQTVSLLLYLAIYKVRPIAVDFWPSRLALEKDMCRRLYAIGIPASLNLALPSLLISSLNVILAGYSQSYVFVLGVYYKLQTFLYLPANGIIQGVRPLVGYNYGAGEYGRVRKIYAAALALTAVIMAAGTVLCLAVPEALIGMFTSNGTTIEAGAKALRIISAGFIISSVSVVSSGTLEGLSMGVPSLMIALFRYVLVIIPAAWILSRFLGADGVWHSFWITEILTAAAAYWICCRKNVTARPDRSSGGKTTG